MNKICTALAFLLASSFQVEAAQILVQSSPTESTVAVVSRNEPNLFQIEGRKIKRIYGTEGLFTVTPEADTGVAWLKPLTDKNKVLAALYPRGSRSEEKTRQKQLRRIGQLPHTSSTRLTT